MSVNRENVTWKSNKTGKWYRGFFDYFQTGEDYEWDVEYDFDSFNWAAGPFDTYERADNSWDGANPGGRSQDEDDPRCDRYDELFREHQERVKKSEAEYRKNYGTSAPRYSYRF